ncbi:MAG: response regulator [Cyanobacteria bacterium P01_F01_bin.42]
MMRFESGQLQQYIMRLEKKQINGVLSLTLDLPQPNSTRTIQLAFRQGKITYATENFIAPVELVTFIAAQLGTTFLDPALKVVQPRVKNPHSVQEMLDLICRFGLFSWEAVESVLKNHVIYLLELSLPYSGSMAFNAGHPFDLQYPSTTGFAIESLMDRVKERAPTWASLNKSVAGIDSVPLLNDEMLGSIESDEIRAHLRSWVDGQRSLGTIALEIKKDPLELAKRYFQFSRKGWITFKASPGDARSASTQADDSSSFPIVLSVDDSPVVQTVIKRSICDRYQVLLANNAVDALNMLNNHPVALLLLDVTMPDIDGLELCRTIRSISKFRDLPVVMLTAKDGLLDKVKGQFAGSTHYLTKPIDREKLLAVLDKYIPQAVIA